MNYSINVTSLYPRKQLHLICFVVIYCHIVVVWNQTHTISEVCLYLFPLAIGAKWHELGDLRQQKFIPL